MPRAIKEDADYPTSIRLSAELRKDLRTEATRQRRSMTWLITEILAQWQAYNRARHNAKLTKGEKT